MEKLSSSARFAFGRNWRRFTQRYLDEEATAFAVRSLSDLLESSDLSRLSFVDVGCGSGLSSLSALRLGAERILSFDLDPEAVDCCKDLRERNGSPAEWEIRQGSILDPSFVAELGTFDIVYSWGVLHHTGDLWKAMAAAESLLKEAGMLVIAIYNKADAFGIYPDGRFGPSSLWVSLKKLYCRLPVAIQGAVDLATLGVFMTWEVARLRNPRRSLREYRKARGMDLRVDIKDWLGGYPYEYASVEEVFRFLRPLGFELANLRFHGGLRCNEYVFRRSQQPSP